MSELAPAGWGFRRTIVVAEPKPEYFAAAAVREVLAGGPLTARGVRTHTELAEGVVRSALRYLVDNHEIVGTWKPGRGQGAHCLEYSLVRSP